MKDTRRIPEDLERELRDWAARPPARTAREARQRVLARLETRAPRRRAALWAAALFATAAAAALLVRAPRPIVAPPSTLFEGSAPATIVFELDSGTRLYFTPARRPATGRS